jgi:thymidylate synthase
VDSALGLPFNIASYALLLHLLAKEAGLKEGKLIGFLGDTHIYENHIEGLKEQLKREPYKLPNIKTKNFKSIFDWKYRDSELIDYKKHPPIKFNIAV